jgi:hypothetical protein
VADQALLDDYQHAPRPRQEEIGSFLISMALDGAQPDVVRQNAVSLLRRLRPITQNAVKVSLAARLQDRLGRRPLDDVCAHVAHASGALPYLSRAQRAEFFKTIYERLQKVGTGWRAHPHHGELLRTLKELGGLLLVPLAVRKKIVEWLALAYIGEPGGYGTFGRRRRVFYSDTAAPLVEELVAEAATVIKDDLRACESSRAVKRAVQDEYVARRFQELLDIVDTHASSD